MATSSEPNLRPAEQESGNPQRADTPEARMARRFPQPVRVGDLIGLRVLDYDDRTIGIIRRVMRTPSGKIVLAVAYGGWFGLGSRLVAAPIEVLAIFGRQLASLDMQPEDYAAAPTFAPQGEIDIPLDETIRIALTKR
jgi:hypothetical protein